MSDHPDSTTVPKSIGELSENIVSKLAQTRPADGRVANAMRSLESQVHDLMHMSHITSDIGEAMFSRPDRAEGEYLVLTMHVSERDTFLFALGNVEERVRKFKAGYMAAFDGETV